MNGFQIWSPDNPQPQPVEKSLAWIGNKISFIEAHIGTQAFYIAAAEDEPETIFVKCYN